MERWLKLHETLVTAMKESTRDDHALTILWRYTRRELLPEFMFVHSRMESGNLHQTRALLKVETVLCKCGTWWSRIDARNRLRLERN